MAFKTPCLARFLGPILFCLLLSTITLAAGPAPADPFSAPPFDGSGGRTPFGAAGPARLASASLAFDPCDDLFKAACLQSDGSLKERAVKDGGNSTIQAALQAAVREMGYNSLGEGFVAFLRRNGLQPRTDLSPQKAEELLRSSRSDPSEYFVAVPKGCTDVVASSPEQNALVDLLVKESRKADLATYYAQRTVERQAELARFRERIIEELNRDNNFQMLIAAVQGWCTSDIQEEVDRLKQRVEAREKELAGEQGAQKEADREALKAAREQLAGIRLPDACSLPSLMDLKSEGVLLFRDKDPERRMVRAFVAKHSDLYFHLKELRDSLLYIKLPEELPSASAGRRPPVPREFAAVNRKLYHACGQLKSLMEDEISQYRSSYLENLARSRPAVETMLRATYSPRQKEKVEELFAVAHSALLGFIDEELATVPDLQGGSKLAKIRAGAEKLSFSWLEPPEADLYRMDPSFPLPVLDLDRVSEFAPLRRAVMQAQRYISIGLPIMRSRYGMYRPEAVYGAQVIGETVVLGSLVSELVQEDPYVALAAMAEGLGQKVGYDISVMNGYDLTGVYAKVVECLSGTASVSINPSQVNAAVGEWISARIMARMLRSLPSDLRQTAVVRFSEARFERESERFFDVAEPADSASLETPLVLNGIFGADPDLRRGLGCSEARLSAGYQYCPLLR